MKIKLTKEQKKHIESIRWLYSAPRCSGRTTLLAYVLIECVMETGEKMRIIDHHSSRQADMYLASIIHNLIQENELPLKIDNNGLYLSTVN